MYVPLEALPSYESTAIAPRNDTLLDTSGPLYEWITGGDGWGSSTASGVTINESNALRIAAVWACVRNISEDIGKMPLNVYRAMNPRGREIVYNHPVQRLIHTAPNPQCDAMTFRQTLQAQALTWGNGYAEIVRDNAGEPLSLWFIPSCNVTVYVRDDGSVYYEVWSRNGELTLESHQMFHLRGLGCDPYMGLSPIRNLRETLGLAKAAEESAGQLFGNGAVPSGVLEHPGSLKKEAKDYLRKSWEELHGGRENRWKTAILEGGMKYHPMTIPFKDAQFLELRQFSVDEIARIFRVPPHKIMDLTHGTFSNIEHQNIEYVTDCLYSWAVRWEQEIDRKLIPTRQQATLYSRHVLQALLRGDTAMRQAFYTAMFNIGVYSPNDIRELEEDNPVPGGDTYFVQANVVPLEIAAKGPPEPPPPVAPPESPPNEPKPAENRRRAMIAAHIDVLADAVGHVLRVEHDRVRRAVGRPNAAELIDKFYATHRAEVYEALSAPLRAFACASQLLTGNETAAILLNPAISRATDEHLAISRVEMCSMEQMAGWLDGSRATAFAAKQLATFADWLDSQLTDNLEA